MAKPKGTVNKTTLLLRERVEALGIDPLQILCHFAAGDWKALGYDSPTKSFNNGQVVKEIITSEMRLKAAEELVQYMYPKQKAIEIDATIEGNGLTVVTLKEFRQALADDQLNEDPES